MTDLRARMVEDRYLRDSARALIQADVQNLRSGLTSRSIANRAVDRLKDGALDVYDEAVAVAADNKGALAALVAALFLWLVGNPLNSLFRDRAGDESDEAGEEYAEEEEMPEH